MFQMMGESKAEYKSLTSRREATQCERCSEATLVDALNDRVKPKKMDKTSESQE